MEKPVILDIENGFHSLVIAIGFDGVCVKDKFPRIGEDIGAAHVLRKLTDTGHRLLLYTSRIDIKHVNPGVRVGGIYDRFYLTQALLWFEMNKIPVWSVNINPEVRSVNYSGKIHADLFIDNKALGSPLVSPFNERPYIDWLYVDKWLDRACYYWNGVK